MSITAAEPPHSLAFEKAISVAQIDSNTYSANLDSKWCIGSVPHGGYIGSILYRATTAYFENTKRGQFTSSPEPISFQIAYLRRTTIGSAILKVQDIKIGSRVSTVHVSLLQTSDGTLPSNDLEMDSCLEVKVVAYINVSPPNAEIGPSYEGDWALEPAPASGSCSDGSVNLSELAKNQSDCNWTRIQLPSPAMFAMGNTELFGPREPSPVTLESRAKKVVDQWTRFAPDGKVARWSNEAVVFLLDLFPAALDRMAAMESSRILNEKSLQKKAPDLNVKLGPFWFPTVTLNIDLKTRLPSEGVEWLYSRVVTRMLRNSRADLEVVVLDQNKALVATSSQVALVVDASRNTQPRKDKGNL